MTARVLDLVRGAYDAMEIDNTPTHTEVMVTPAGPRIVEVGCRGGGFFVFSRVVQAASGYDIAGNWTRLCAGDPVEIPRVQSRGVVLRFFAAKPGRLVAIRGVKEASAIEGVQVGMFVRIGDQVPELVNDGTRTGWIIARGRDRAEAVAKADQVCDLVRFEVEA
jgi:hypothetical protein